MPDDTLQPPVFPNDAELEPQRDATGQLPAQPTPGRQASKNGEALEYAVLARLQRCGYEQIKVIPPSYTSAFFIHHWRGSGLQSVTKTTLVPDFFIWHPVKYPEGCLLECKWQETPGSAEAKICILTHSLLATPYRSILILNGPGFTRHYLEYYKSLENERLTVITSSDELMVRMNRGLF